ncbi:MAG: ABC transporter permease [Bryobacterales bacterium]
MSTVEFPSAAAARQETLEALPENDGVFDGLRELYRFRELLLMWTDREIRIRYKQSVLGAAWAILQPLCLMLALTVVFSYFAPMPSDGVPYPIFSYTALLPWTFFATAISFSVPSMTNNMQLISKIYFPREILPLASVIVAFVDFLFATVVFAGLFLFYDIPVTVNLLWVAPLLLLQTVLILGIVFWVSALVVRFRDLRFVVPLTIQLWMYASPIIYPMSVVPDKVKPFYQLNPMAGLIESYREAVLRGGTPDAAPLLSAALVSGALLISGYRFFKKSESEFADII